MAADPNADTIAPALRAVVLRLARRLRVERGRSALSHNKVAILSHLAREGESTPSRISADERQHPQSLSRPLAELEESGLIVRTTDRVDGRRSVLRLTAEGRAAFDADMRLRDRWLAELLEGLDVDKLRTLAEAAGILEQLDGPRA